MDQDGTCLATDTGETEEDEETVESDLEMAARYYRLAADVHKSPRANFNLGFLYEWGLGVKQDFPLAKRHYDLARDAPSGEAEIAAKIALFALKQHERLVKYFAEYQEWFQSSTGGDDSVEGQQIPTTTEGANVGHPVPPGPSLNKQCKDQDGRDNKAPSQLGNASDTDLDGTLVEDTATTTNAKTKSLATLYTLGIHLDLVIVVQF